MLVLPMVFVVLAPSVVSAAEAPRVQIFGGYSRLQFDSKSLGFTSNTGLNGGTGSVAFNLAPFFGAVGEFSVESGPNIRSRDWLIGPQVMYGKWGALFFGHALFGKGETRATTTVVAEDNGGASAFGGGVDIPAFHRFSIRVIQVDYFKTHTLSTDQNNVKFSTGVVFRWGVVSSKPKHKL